MVIMSYDELRNLGFLNVASRFLRFTERGSVQILGLLPYMYYGHLPLLSQFLFKIS